MNKIINYTICAVILFVLSGNANGETDNGANNTSKVFNQGFSGQKSISDSKFKKTIEQMKERSLSKKQKKMREQVKPNEPSADNEYLKKFSELQDPNNALSQSLTVMIPVKAYNEDGKYIQPGYYKLSCRKIAENKYVLDLSQGSQRVLTVEANQTKQDLEQDTIQFCNAEIISNGRIRLVFGSIDLNLAGYLYYDERY